MTQISRGCYNADTENIIVNTCTICILENAKLQWNIEIHMLKCLSLTRTGPISTTADDKFCDIFPGF